MLRSFSKNDTETGQAPFGFAKLRYIESLHVAGIRMDQIKRSRRACFYANVFINTNGVRGPWLCVRHLQSPQSSEGTRIQPMRIQDQGVIINYYADGCQVET